MYLNLYICMYVCICTFHAQTTLFCHPLRPSFLSPAEHPHLPQGEHVPTLEKKVPHWAAPARVWSPTHQQKFTVKIGGNVGKMGSGWENLGNIGIIVDWLGNVWIFLELLPEFRGNTMIFLARRLWVCQQEKLVTSPWQV